MQIGPSSFFFILLPLPPLLFPPLSSLLPPPLPSFFPSTFPSFPITFPALPSLHGKGCGGNLADGWR